MTKFTSDQLVVQSILARNVGQALKELREAYGLTQYQVAAGAGCHQTRISGTERGTWQPSISSIVDHLMGIGVARARREICNDECPCKQFAKHHTAEESPDST